MALLTALVIVIICIVGFFYSYNSYLEKAKNRDNPDLNVYDTLSILRMIFYVVLAIVVLLIALLKEYG